VVGVLPYKQLANHVYGLIVFPSPAVYSNPYSKGGTALTPWCRFLATPLAFLCCA
jgi:hypothetical protein